MFSGSSQVTFWFDSAKIDAGLTLSRKLVIVCLNLVLTMPLQMVIHFIFSRSESSWCIPGLAELPVPEPPRWYQQLVCPYSNSFPLPLCPRPFPSSIRRFAFECNRVPQHHSTIFFCYKLSVVRKSISRVQ